MMSTQNSQNDTGLLGNHVQEANTEKVIKNKSEIYRYILFFFPDSSFNYLYFLQPQIKTTGRSVTFKTEISFTFLQFIMRCFSQQSETHKKSVPMCLCQSLKVKGSHLPWEATDSPQASQEQLLLPLFFRESHFVEVIPIIIVIIFPFIKVFQQFPVHSDATAHSGRAGMRLQAATAFDWAQRKQFPWQPQPQKGPKTAFPPA